MDIGYWALAVGYSSFSFFNIQYSTLKSNFQGLETSSFNWTLVIGHWLLDIHLFPFFNIQYSTLKSNFQGLETSLFNWTLVIGHWLLDIHLFLFSIFNIQHSNPISKVWKLLPLIGHWLLGIGCWIFISFLFSISNIQHSNPISIRRRSASYGVTRGLETSSFHLAIGFGHWLLDIHLFLFSISNTQHSSPISKVWKLLPLIGHWIWLLAVGYFISFFTTTVPSSGGGGRGRGRWTD